MHPSVVLLINHLVEVDQAPNFLILWLLLVALIFRPNLHYCTILVRVLLLLFFKSTDVFLFLLLSLLWLELIYISNERILAHDMTAFKFLFFCNSSSIEVAIEEFKTRHAVPGRQHVTLEYNDFICLH